jgi:dCMP deaminase
MKTVKSWHTYFLDLAKSVATRSKDPSTNVGAVIVNADKSIVEAGYNGFAPGVAETDERWERPTKYDFVIHAEQNAIGRAARFGKTVNGSTLYVTHYPCRECAKMIIASGIRAVYAEGFANMTKKEDIAFVECLFKEAGVESYIIP